MKVLFFLFLAVLLAGTVLLKQREPMTCTRPVFGPNGKLGIYGPGDSPMSNYIGGAHSADSTAPHTEPSYDTEPSHQTTAPPEETTPVSVTLNKAPIEDDGKFSSDTATRNPKYLPVYNYSPPIERAFPVEEGGPQPFLNNFDRIGR